MNANKMCDPGIRALIPGAQLSQSDSAARCSPGDLNGIVAACLKRIRRWPVPQHWSIADWWDEASAHGQAAAWEALGDNDPARGVPLSAFVHQRVRASILTRYRQERAYATHCVSSEQADANEAALEDFRSFTQDGESLRQAMGRLSEVDCWLIDQLFWNGCTETEVAHQRRISPQAISKRKQAIIDILREFLQTTEGK